MMNMLGTASLHRQVVVSTSEESLDGRVIVPRGCVGVVLLARGPSERNHRPLMRRVARMLHDAGLATLTVNLLTPDEEMQDRRDGRFVRNFELLADRIVRATNWIEEQPGIRGLPVGFYAMNATAASALLAAARLGARIRAVVCHQGRPDLVEHVLRRVAVPCLFVVIARGEEFVEMSRGAMALMRGPSELVVYDEMLTPDVVGRVSTQFFDRYVRGAVE